MRLRPWQHGSHCSNNKNEFIKKSSSTSRVQPHSLQISTGSLNGMTPNSRKLTRGSLATGGKHRAKYVVVGSTNSILLKYPEKPSPLFLLHLPVSGHTPSQVWLRPLPPPSTFCCPLQKSRHMPQRYWHAKHQLQREKPSFLEAVRRELIFFFFAVLQNHFFKFHLT